jgi:hypothetical protein
MWPFSTVENKIKYAIEIIKEANDEHTLEHANIILIRHINHIPLLQCDNLTSSIVDKCFYFWERQTAVPQQLRNIISLFNNVLYLEFFGKFLNQLQEKWMMPIHDDCTIFSLKLICDDRVKSNIIEHLPKLRQFLSTRSVLHASSLPQCIWSRVLELCPMGSLRLISDVMMTSVVVLNIQELSSELVRLLFNVSIVSLEISLLQQLSYVLRKINIQLSFDQFVEFIYLNTDLTKTPHLSKIIHWIIVDILRNSIHSTPYSKENRLDPLHILRLPTLTVVTVISRLLQRMNGASELQLHISKTVVFIWIKGGEPSIQVSIQFKNIFKPIDKPIDYLYYERFLKEVEWV